MRPIRLDTLSDEQLHRLDELHRTTRNVRVRTRVQMVPAANAERFGELAAEQGLVAAQVAPIVRQDEEPG